MVTVALLLGLGYLVADQLTAALRLSTQPVTVPAETLTAEPQRAIATYAPVRTVLVDAPASPLLELATTTYADAVEARTGVRPDIRSRVPGTGTAFVMSVDVSSASALPPQGYRVSARGLRIEAHDDAGAAAGLFQLADRYRTGRPLPQTPEVVQPRLGLRMLDSGAIGVQPDAEAWRKGDDYSHNNHAFANAILADAPYVDQAALATDAADFRAFVDHGVAQGYNALAINGFLEYLTFSGVGDGNQVYPPGDPHRERALAMRRSFGPMLEYAHTMGMELVLKTDMLALTTPLEQYLQRTSGSVDAEDPRLWQVYEAGLDELFTTMPYVDALMVRIGEAGSVYDVPGWDYYSRLAVTTVPAVRRMLTSFTKVAEQHRKDIVFRTWSVGVGDVGDMHTSQKSYAAVLKGIDSPRLVVSTKYTLGDFYSHLPLNDTLDTGDHRRLVEFQGRREFEDFGALPNDLSVLHREALQRFLAANPKVEGVWLWTQDGGPWRAGPMTLYLKTGFWQLYDLSAYAMGRLAWDPSTDPAQLTADWARRTFSDHPATVAAISGAMALSREAIGKGLYIGPYADQKVKALGLEPPPMMWIFEWDIVSGDSATLGTIYDTSKDQLARALSEADDAVALATRMRTTVEATDPATYRDASLRQHLVDTLAYEQNLFETLRAYRTMALRHEQWLDTGSDEAKDAWSAAAQQYVAARDSHLARYAGDVDLPAYQFAAADLGMQRAQRDSTMGLLAACLLALLVVALLLGTTRGQRLLREGTLPGVAALRALWIGATRPWRITTAPAPAGRLDRVLVWLLPALAIVVSRLGYTWFAAPAHLLVTLGAWLLFVLVLRVALRGRDPWLLWAAVGGAAILRTAILLVALVSHGPGGYWFAFWTRPGARTLYVTIAFAAFVWVLVVAWMAMRDAYGASRRGAWGRLLVACGVPLLLLGGLVAAIGLETALTAWNDQMALLPWGLSRILGITVYLGIPTELPVYVAALGGLLAMLGTALWLRTSTHDRPPALEV
ncbi:MAG TPA: hypothetical protein VFL59_02425 [Candidatus Nanopelagicales bacterium]|nr:hypothetical protein [Candidatus Nanopelagicales bacterium]